MASDWREKGREDYQKMKEGGKYSLSDGENSIRPLAGITRERKLGAPAYIFYWMHEAVGPDGRFLRCGKDDTGQGDCWLCDEQMPKLAASSESAKRKRAAKMEPIEQIGIQIAYVDAKGRWHGPVLWATKRGGAKAILTRVMGIITDTKRDYTSLSKGYNLNIERSGTGLGTTYELHLPDEDPTPVPKEIAMKMKCLDDVIQQYSEEQQKSAYFGREVDETPEEVEDAVGGDGPEGYLEEESVPGEGGEIEEPEAVESTAGDIGDSEFEDLFSSDTDEAPQPKTQSKPAAKPAQKKPAPAARRRR